MFEVYSKPGCSYCEQAKTLLMQKDEPYVEKVLDVGQDKVPGVEYYTKEDLLAVFPDARTVPQIIYVANDEFEATTKIGGYTQLVQFFNRPEDEV